MSREGNSQEGHRMLWTVVDVRVGVVSSFPNPNLPTPSPRALFSTVWPLSSHEVDGVRKEKEGVVGDERWDVWWEKDKLPTHPSSPPSFPTPRPLPSIPNPETWR